MCSHIYEAFAAIFLYRHHLVEAANSFMLYFISFCKHTILFGATLIFSKGQVFFNNCCLWHLLLVCSVVLFNTFDSSMDGVWYATLTLSSLSLVYYFWWWVSLCESWLDQISWHESHLWAVCVFTSVQMTEELPEFQSDSSLSDLHLFTAAVTCTSGLTHTFRHREQIWHDPPPH